MMESPGKDFLYFIALMMGQVFVSLSLTFLGVYLDAHYTVFYTYAIRFTA